MIADRDASFESKHVVDGGMVDAVKSSDNEACQKSTTYRKIVLYVLMAASKNFVAVKQPYEFFNGIGPNLFSSFSLPPPPAFLLRPPSFFLLPSPKRRRPAHFWFIWGLCLKRVKVSQRARSLNFLAEQLSTVLEIPRVLKRKTYAEFLSLKETDLLVVCLLWTKGDAMLNPSIAITSGFFGNVFFFFFFPFRAAGFFFIRFVYPFGDYYFLGNWILCTFVRFVHPRVQKGEQLEFIFISFQNVGEWNSEWFATAVRSFKSCHAAKSFV